MTTPTILFVDDEANILKALQRLFLDEDYDVHTANSGKEALQMIEDGLQPTVIISDQRMPEMGGAEFLAKARKAAPDSVRMVLTGYADINAAVSAINEGGIYRYILKPWSDDDLKLSIQNGIQHYNLFVENRQLTLDLAVKNLELAQLNEVLELKVEERTRELRDKIKELEGRDRIQQYLMSVHPLPELLDTILDVVIDVTGARGAAFYLFEEGNSVISQKASQNFEETGFSEEDTDLHKSLLENARADDDKSAVIKVDENYVIAPIHKGKQKLGALVVRFEQDSDFPKSELKTITGFARQAAIGINDSRLQENFDDIETSLDDVLATI
jgi:CheY-like chemotaxis protein